MIDPIPAPACRRPRIAVVIERIGPYHRARMEALARRVPALAVEICARDETYPWETEPNCRVARTTLFATLAEARMIPRLRTAVDRALEAFGPDVVAVPGWSQPAGLLALAWARARGVPAVLMSDSQATDSRRVAAAEAVKRAVVALASAGLVGGRTHADYLAALGMPRNRIALGYDVVDNAHFARGADAARQDAGTRRALDLPERYILALARFVEKKNLGALIEAHARWFAAAPDPVPLVLAGDGPLRSALERAAGRHVVIRPFAGYHSLPALYGLAEGFVLSSVVEQWGLTVNEAMASGCPVIASDRAGVTAELVEDGVTGIVAPPTVDGLAAALARLAEVDRCALAEAARRRIAGWTPERFADGMLEAAGHALAAVPVRPRLLALLEGPALLALARRRVAA